MESAETRLDSILADIEGVLQVRMFDDELEAADDLHRKGHHRAAGALTGVTLERHLKKVADNHQVKIAKRDPTIADLNEALKAAGVLDIPTWRFIQRLGDIRNLCSHHKGHDPSKDDVTDLIAGTRKIVKTLF
ncbi:MAG: hypothetical protein M3Q65_24830 [Chloroflexota bacterium]|nr:hypothetical protein [Chloroflexota bacterium]